MAQTSTPAAAAPCTVGENSCWATARGVTQSRGVPPHQSPWGGGAGGGEVSTGPVPCSFTLPSPRWRDVAAVRYRGKRRMDRVNTSSDAHRANTLWKALPCSTDVVIRG